jgi:hypothetical protein
MNKFRYAILAGAVAAAIAAVGPAQAQPYGYGMMGGYGPA